VIVPFFCHLVLHVGEWDGLHYISKSETSFWNGSQFLIWTINNNLAILWSSSHCFNF